MTPSRPLLFYGLVVAHMFLSPFSLITSVQAHGYVSQIVIDGKTYTGPTPYEGSPSTSTPIRKITTGDPITEISSSAMTCGTGATTGKAKVTAAASPGSKLTFTWKSSSGGNWGHSFGPIMTYIALCPSSGCVDYNPTSAEFYKIAETGRKSGSMTWVQADIKAGKTYSMNLPSNLPDGDYIVRHEIIALHYATSKNGAQFYPSCSQISVSSGAKAVTSLSSVANGTGATFPGGYSADDPGIYVPNLYTSMSYIMPGPDVVTFSGASAGSGDTTTAIASDNPAATTTFNAGNGGSVSTTTSADPAATTTSTGSGSSNCQRRRRRRRHLHSARSKHSKSNSRLLKTVGNPVAPDDDSASIYEEALVNAKRALAASVLDARGGGEKAHWNAVRRKAFSSHYNVNRRSTGDNRSHSRH